MKSKIIVICTFLLILLCSLSVVVAQDITDDTQMTNNNTDDVTLTNNEADGAPLMDPPQGSFDELQGIIDDADEESDISLDKDYTGSEDSYIKIDKTLTIDGQGHTIDCDHKCIAFSSSSGEITLQNLIIKNSKVNKNGAIFINGNAKYTIINCSFVNDPSTGGGRSIYNNVEDETLTIINSTFKWNCPIYHVGGAIYSKGDVSIENSVFENNTAYDGGAIYSYGSLDIISSNFTSNRATASGSDGGAIFAKSQINVEECNFINNVANQGGAIRGYAAVLVRACQFMNNTAYRGGAIFKTGGEFIAIEDSIFSGNTATLGSGGAIYGATYVSIGHSNFSGNTAKTEGGAIYSEYIQFDGESSFIANHAQGHGGAIYTSKIAREVNDLYFESNYADDDFGGALYINNKCGIVYFNNLTCVDNHAVAGDGGAIFSDSSATHLNLNNCVFIGNSANGGVEKRYGGAVRACGYLSVYNSYFKDNLAENHGGAIYTNSLGSIENCVFISNRAQKDDGGAVYINNECTSTISKSYFESNSCNNRGGAIYTDSKDGDLYLNNNAFLSNGAGDQGKDVFNSGYYKSISGNWWGSNSPTFNDEKLMEYHTVGSNEKHVDASFNTVSIIGDGRVYEHMLTTIKIAFAKDVPRYLLESINISSDKSHVLKDRKISGNTVELTYIPLEEGIHKISSTINSQTVIHELTSEFISVYGYDIVKTQGDTITYEATFRYANGTYLNPGEKVIFTLHGDEKEYIHTVSENGTATFDEILRMGPGTYQVTARNNITKENFINRITILSRAMVYNINDTFIMKFIDSSSDNKSITFKIGEKTFISTINNSAAYFRLDVPAGNYTVYALYEDNVIESFDIEILNQYSKSLLQVKGDNYAALVPIYNNERFIEAGNVIYSELGDNTRRYIFHDGTGAIVYNVTISNNAEFTDVLRKISAKDFYVDIIILNLKPGTYQISESFYRDQEWNYLIHLTNGRLLINGNGAVIDDNYRHNFVAIESGASVAVQGLTFKKFYRVFVNNGNLYCSDCTFIENDARFFATNTPGSVVYNKKQATFERCVFDHNINDNARSLYAAKLKASIYADSRSLTNLVECKFTEDDTIHAVDNSMVVLYDDTRNNFELFTKDTRNNFELGSCLDYRPVSSYNANRTGVYNYTNFQDFVSDLQNDLHSDNASDFIINLEGRTYSISMSDYESMTSSIYDFRTYNRHHTSFTVPGDKDDNLAYHHYLLDVGSRPIVINGNGATIELKGSDVNKENHFAFVPYKSSLTLINITISGFNTAIVNHGNLILINCTLNNNMIHYGRFKTFEAEKGGAIRNYASVHCYNTTFTGNSATMGAAYYSKGSSAFGQFYNCSFDENCIISNWLWKNGDDNTLFVDDSSAVKIIECNGIGKSNTKTDGDGLILYRDTLNMTVYNFEVDSVYALMKLSNLVNDNEDYDIINVTFVKGDYGTFPNSKILFDIDYCQLMLTGNGARIFVSSPKDNDVTQFMVTTKHSSVIMTGLTVEGYNIAINNGGALNILNSSFINNRVDYITKKDYGGAIFNDEGATLTIYNSTFSGNYAKYGGAIYNKGISKAIISTFSNNTGYDSKSDVDIYNHQASTTFVAVGNSLKMIDHFPMPAWKQWTIEAGIHLIITLVASCCGFATASITIAHTINMLLGIGIGAIGGTIHGLIYSNDNQDYSTMVNKIMAGISTGMAAVTFADYAGDLMNGGVTKYIDYTKEQIIEETFQAIYDEFLGMTMECIDDWVSAAINEEYNDIIWYSLFKDGTIYN